jgi:prepilin-type N-terminal cleavage/methylation domain-containing protein
MRHNQKGFTLTELMATLVISSIVLVAVVNFFISGIGHNKRYEESRNNQEVINVISDLMYRDIMEADLSKACEPEGEFNLISISINNECHHYYIESGEENYILKYQKDDGSFILAKGIVNRF